jgi:transcriptional regulator with XRE-family HTH domain
LVCGRATGRCGRARGRAGAGFGTALRRFRVAAGLSQEALAEWSGLSVDASRRWSGAGAAMSPDGLIAQTLATEDG